MKILFVSAVFPYPLHSGGQVRIYNLLKRLAKKHEITLYVFIRDESEKKFLGELSFCKKIVPVMRGRAWQAKYFFGSLFSNYPFLYATYNNAHMRNLLKEELASQAYDLVHLEPGYVWLSLPETSIPVVVSEHNIEHEVYERYADHFWLSFVRPLLRWDVAKMAKWAKRIWRNANHITTVTADDQEKIKNEVEKSKVTVVPNGVDPDHFSFVPKKHISHSSPIFLYVGTFAWIQNRDAIAYLLQDVWPRVIKKYPKAILRIIGKGVPPQLVRANGKGVTFLESVEDIHEEYASADILLAPIRVGGGTKYKIIESMATGLPVLTTPLGAQGISIDADQVLWIAQTVPEILEAIQDITDGPNRKKIVETARKLVEAEYSWDGIAQALDSVWEKT